MKYNVYCTNNYFIERHAMDVQKFTTRAYYTGGGTGCIHCSANELQASDFACSWGVGNWNGVIIILDLILFKY
jgi:hypothetical protein